ncbi:MAG: HAMP domain-containing histidine kinase [Geminicoccaceae bacterium]|nr:HAMP domain-containing histidine kinase [Geminicoccaceae bacterium]
MNISVESNGLPHLLMRQFERLPRAAIIMDMSGGIHAMNSRLASVTKAVVDGHRSGPFSLADIVRDDPRSLLNDIRHASRGDRVAVHLHRADPPDRSATLFRVWPLTLHMGRVRDVFLEEDEARQMRRVFSDLNTRLRLSNRNEARARHEVRRLRDRNDFLEIFGRAAFHDLKSPLNQIRGCTTWLADDYSALLPPGALELLKMINEATDRLQKLIESVASLSHADSATLEKKRISVKHSIEDVISCMDKSVLDEEIRIECRGSFFDVVGDEFLFTRLMQNIIENSMKYRSPKRVLAITVSMQRSNRGEVRLSLRDNGIGFDNSHARKIFEPFQRLHLYSDVAGSGIGLATCKAICDRHGWSIEARGEVDAGAEFTIAFDDSRAAPDVTTAVRTDELNLCENK